MKPSLKTADGKALCTTPECVIAGNFYSNIIFSKAIIYFILLYNIASELIQSLDLTADPCEDFFQYACGGWIDKHPIPASKSRWTQFDILRDQLSADIAGNIQYPHFY